MTSCRRRSWGQGPTAKRPVKRSAVHIQELGHVLAAMLPSIYELPGVCDLLCNFRLRPNFAPRPLGAFTPARVRPPLSLDFMPDFLVPWPLGPPGRLDRTFLGVPILV